MTEQFPELADLPLDELTQLLHAALTELTGRHDPEAFAALLHLSAHLGICIGEAARSVATHESWSRVADLSGTTKQAAWSRWRGAQ